MSFRFPERWRALESSPNPLSEAVARRRAAGLPLLDLTGSNPTTAGIPLPVDWTTLLADPVGLVYAPESKGLRAAREAVARYYAERDGSRNGTTSPVDAEAVFLTAGTSEGYAHLFKLLCEPGDAILVPSPSYPLLDTLAELSGIALIGYPLGDGRIDFDAMARACTPRTRAILVVNPNNPTGHVLTAEEERELLSFAGRRDLAVIVDEVFADYTFDSETSSRPKPARRLASHDVPVFTLNGLSKLVGLPQLKVAWIHVEGPARDTAVAKEGLEWMCDANLSVGTAAQLAAPELLRRRREFQEPIRARLAKNLKTLREIAADNTNVQPLWPEGGWAVPMRCPGVVDDEAFAIRLVETSGVLVQPGYFYDFDSEDMIVASLLTPPEIFREAIDRIAKGLSARG